MQSNYKELFNNTPIVFCGVNDIKKGLNLSNNPNFTGVIEAVSLRETIDLSLKLHPNISKITAIVDTTPTGIQDAKKFYNISKEFKPLLFDELSLADLTFTELSRKLKEIDKTSIIILISALKDKTNKTLSFQESLNLITENTKVPIYHLFEHGIGQGIIGGKVISHYSQGKTAGKLALKILKGESVSNISVVEKSPNEYIFDYKELKKFKIKLSNLPKNSLIIDKPFSFYETYKPLVLNVITFIIILTIIIILLIINIIRRKASERELQLFAKVLENNKEGVVITDEDGNIEWINEAFTKITGYTDEEAKGENPKILRSEKHDDDFYKNMWETIISKGIWKGRIFNKRKNGTIYPEILKIFSIKNNHDNTIHFVGIHTDISEDMEKEKIIEFLAYRDSLTKLYNRAFFINKLNEEISNNIENNLAIMFLDLDGFKKVNDTLGHSTGDIVLQLFSKRLVNAVKKDDIIARFGGDEFIVLFPQINNIEFIINIANRILDTFKEPFVIDDQEVYLSVSIGISKYPDAAIDASSLIKNADTAMYLAKKSKNDKIKLFSSIVK